MNTRIYALILAVVVAAPAGAEEKPAGRVGAARLRHGAEIVAAAYSSDGKLLACVANDEIVCVFNAATGDLQHQFGITRALVKEPNAPPAFGPMAPPLTEGRLQFAPGNRRLYVALGTVITTYDFDQGKQVSTEPLPPTERCAALSPGGVAVIGGKSSDMRLIDLSTGKKLTETAKLPAPDRTTRTVDAKGSEQLLWQRETDFPARAELTPHGLLASGKFVARLFDAKTGKLNREWNRAKPGDFSAITLSPDGATLAFVATVSAGNPTLSKSTLIHLDVKTGNEREVPSALGGGQVFAFSPDFTTLAAFGRDGLLLVDVKTGRTLRTIPAPVRVSRLLFSPDGRTLAAVSETANTQWDVATGQRLAASSDPPGRLNRLRFLDNRRLLAFADELVEYDWRVATALKRYPLLPHAKPAGDDVSPDGAVAVVVDSGCARLVETATGKTREELPAGAWNGRALFTSDGKRVLFLPDNGGCQSWDLAARKLTPVVPRPAESSDFAFAASADGRLLAGRTGSFLPFGDTSGEANIIRLWDGRTGTKLRDLKLPEIPSGELAFSPDGRRLAILTNGNDPQEFLGRGPGGGFGAVREHTRCSIWDPDSGRLVRQLDVPQSGVACTVLSPDGRAIAFGSGDGNVVVIEIASGAERVRYGGHSNAVHAIAFSPDGRYLASASYNSPILVWDLFAAPAGAAAAPTKLWTELGRDATSFAAMRRLFAAPDVAVALFREQIKPIAAVPEDRLQKLLDDLDHPKYAERSRAVLELGRVADQAQDRLARALVAKETSAEARQQLRKMLDHLDEPAGHLVVPMRALEVLERLNTPASRALIAEWSAGAPAARFTRESRAALERMKRAVP